MSIKLPDCSKCDNKRRVTEDGVEYGCACVFQFKLRRAASDFLPAKTPPPLVVEAATKAYQSSRFYLRLRHPAYLNGFMVLYLSNVVADRKSSVILKTYQLPNRFLGKGEEKELPSPYSYKQQTIVLLHSHASLKNRAEVPLIYQMLDFYKSGHQLLLVALETGKDVANPAPGKLEFQEIITSLNAVTRQLGFEEMILDKNGIKPGPSAV